MANSLSALTFPAAEYGTPSLSSPADVAALGVAPTLARSDHKHGREAALAVATTVASGSSFGSATSVGTLSSYAREDHQHGTPSLSAAAAATLTFNSTSTVGAGTVAARSDHTHGLPAEAIASVAGRTGAITLTATDIGAIPESQITNLVTDLASKYSASNPPPSSASVKSTVGAGQPSFAARATGDLHYDTTAKQELVLTGLVGVSASDNFNRPNSTGLGTTSSGTLWQARGGAAANVQGNVAVTGGSGGVQNYLPLAAGDQTIGCSFAAPDSTANFGLVARLDAAAGTTYAANITVPVGFFQVAFVHTATSLITTTTTMAFVANRVYSFSLAVVGQVLTLTITDSVGGTSYTTSVTDAGAVLTGTNGGFTLGSGSVDDISLESNGTLAWTGVQPTIQSAGAAQTLRPTINFTGAGVSVADDAAGNRTTITIAGGGSGGTDVSAEHFQGAWSSAKAYSKNDLVTRSYGLFSALAGSTNIDPLTTFAPSFTEQAGANLAPGGYQGAYTYLCQFTLTAQITMDSLQISLGAAGGTAGNDFKLGLATAIGANDNGIVFLSIGGTEVGGVVVAGSANYPATNVAGQATAVLTGQVVLPAGTYYFVAKGINGNGAYRGGISNLPAAQGISGQTTLQFNTAAGAAYNTTSTNYFPFALGLGQTPVWSRLSNDQGAVQAAGVAQTVRPAINFTGAGVAVADDAAGNRTTVTIAGGGGATLTVTSVTGATTIVAPGVFLASGGTYPVTLPAATSGAQVTVKNTGTGVITVTGAGAAVIDGIATFALNSQYASLTVVSDGTNWFAA